MPKIQKTVEEEVSLDGVVDVLEKYVSSTHRPMAEITEGDAVGIIQSFAAGLLIQPDTPAIVAAVLPNIGQVHAAVLGSDGVPRLAFLGLHVLYGAFDPRNPGGVDPTVRSLEVILGDEARAATEATTNT